MVALLLLMFSGGLSGAAGDLWLQTALKYTGYRGDLWGYVPEDEKRVRNQGGVGYNLSVYMEIVNGTKLGLSIDYLKVQQTDVIIDSFVIPLEAQAVPVMLSYQKYADALYILVEGGVCLWNGDKGGRDPVVAFGGGYTLPLNSWFNVDLSLKAMMIFSDEVIVPLLFTCGISTRL